MKPLITVFTPTYNRKDLLGRCYEKLCAQTCRNFIWLVVDDGSTDGTRQAVRKWMDEGVISVRYVYQENAGKQRAVNTGVSVCETDWFAFLDSDDYYRKETVEKMVCLIDTIKDDDTVAGILARRCTPDGKTVGADKLPAAVMRAHYDEIIRRYRFSGDTCRVYKTAVLKENLYPVIDDRFIPENVMLGKIDETYKLLVVNESFSVSQYLPDGYTSNEKRVYKKNPVGVSLSLNQLMASNRGRQKQYPVGGRLYAVAPAFSYRKRLCRLQEQKTVSVLPAAVLCTVYPAPSKMDI